jgi:hypothetical protein
VLLFCVPFLSDFKNNPDPHTTGLGLIESFWCARIRVGAGPDLASEFEQFDEENDGLLLLQWSPVNVDAVCWLRAAEAGSGGGGGGGGGVHSLKRILPFNETTIIDVTP